MSSSASFSPRINITNSSAPTPEASPDNTGKIFWVDGRIQEPNEGEEATFIIDYDLSLFQSLFMNGKELILNEDYFLEEGSTIVTIEGSYMAKLPSGDYNLLAKYSDGAEFATVLRITEDAENTDISTLVPNTGTISMQMFGADLAKNTPFIFSGLLLILATFFIARKYLIKRIKNKKHSFSSLNSYTPTRPKVTPQLSSIIPKPNFSLKSHKVLPIIFGFLILTGGVFSLLKIFTPQTSNQEVFAEQVDQNSLDITASEENFTKDVDLKDGNTFVSTTQTITVTNATSHGYKLFISTDSSEYNDLAINGSISADARIAASSNTFTSPDTLETDSYGFAVKNTTFGTNYTPSNTSKWAGVPVLGSETVIKESSSATPANDKTTVYYGFNITDNLPDGAYYGTNNSTIIYKAIANFVPDYSINYYCNGGQGSIASQTKTDGIPITLNDGSSCTRTNYQLKEWNTVSDGSGDHYQLGGSYNKNESANLYAIWEYIPSGDDTQPEPVTYNTFKLVYNANGGSNAPASQSRTTTDSNATFTLSSTKPTRTNYTFKGWCTQTTTTETCSGTTYQASSTITVSAATTNLYAIWQYSGPIYVSSVAISGTNSILLNATNHTTKLTATVSPANATNKTLTWTSSNNAVATVNSSGTVTAVEAGVATITATANDGSGKKASFNVTVNKNVIILLGASQLKRINGSSYANVKSFTSGKNNIYTTTKNNQYDYNRSTPKALNETLNFIYYSGHGFQFETGQNWDTYENATLKKEGKVAASGWDFAKQIVGYYSAKKNYVNFYIYFTILGNDYKYYSCSEINNNASKTVALEDRTIKLPTIENQTKRYNDNITSLTNNGYKVKGYVTSVQPVKASQRGSSKYIVNSNSADSCTANYRSNYKYNQIGKKIKGYISSKGYTSLTYVETLAKILVTSSTTSGWGWDSSWKSTWGTYNTTDGVHWDNSTAKQYLKFWLGLNSNL